MGTASTGQVTRSAAEVYDAFFVPALFAQFPDAVLRAAGVEAGDHVLDVGCGTGVLAAAAAARAGSGNVTGVDVNPDMLQVAARRRPDVTWREGDASRLPFEDGGFDAVVSQFALMFFPDPVGALREMARVARPGGRIAVAVWGPQADSPGYAAMDRLLARVLGDEAAAALRFPFSLGDPARLRELFTGAGLDAAVVPVAGTARFASLRDWIDTEIRGWTLAGSVDDTGLERLQDAAREELQRFVEPAGAVAFPVGALVCSATVP